MDPIEVIVTRGDLVESRHRVHAVAVRDGAVVERAGDPSLVTSMRSAAKPLQALPVTRAYPNLPASELGIACASHEALPEQLDAVEALLSRAGAGENDLECGPEDGSRIRHNCSGKHAGMLLVCAARGWSGEGYRLAGHPLQRELLELVAQAAGLPSGDLATGTDGCGVVSYGLPLEAMARAFGRLAAGELDGADRVVAAMRADPDLIGGPDAVDSGFMRAVPGAVAKRGAEGVLCGALSDGTAFALKVEDGANRAVGPAAAAFLGVAAPRDRPVFNSRGEQVGRIFPNL